MIGGGLAVLFSLAGNRGGVNFPNWNGLFRFRIRIRFLKHGYGKRGTVETGGHRTALWTVSSLNASKPCCGNSRPFAPNSAVPPLIRPPAWPFRKFAPN